MPPKGPSPGEGCTSRARKRRYGNIVPDTRQCFFAGLDLLGGVAGAVIPGLSVLEGAVIGAAVGGLAGAIWADRDNDGRVDGYVYNGQYYQGAPPATAPAPTYTAPAGAGERG